eukprot:1162034-Pelagomonas_calceolata.AAC.5
MHSLRQSHHAFAAQPRCTFVAPFGAFAATEAICICRTATPCICAASSIRQIWQCLPAVGATAPLTARYAPAQLTARYAPAQLTACYATAPLTACYASALLTACYASALLTACYASALLTACYASALLTASWDTQLLRHPQAGAQEEA